MKLIRLLCDMLYGPDGTLRSTNILIFLTNEKSHELFCHNLPTESKVLCTFRVLPT